MRKVTLVLLASVLCISIFLAPVNATAAEGIGSGLVLEAGFGCKMQDGKLVCGNKKGSSKKNDDDDDDDDDDRSKKKKGDDSGLEECTIQQSGGGGGCKTGFKRVCEKLKSGKKCCGCVVDKNAKPVEQPKIVLEYCCRADWTDVTRGTTFCGERAKAEQLAGLSKMDGRPPDRITCVLKE